MRYKEDDLNRLAMECLRIASYVDRHGEKGETEMCNEIGLGYRALGHYLRLGVKAIADIQEEYSEAVMRANLAKVGETEAYDFLEDIFGDRDVCCINDADKERIRTFVHDLEAAWDEEEGDEE